MTVIIGVLFIMFGGLTSGAWYLPLKYVKKWSWESGWLVQGFMAYVIGPWLMALLTVPHLAHIYSQSPAMSLWLPVLFGIGWGIGGLTWGLSIRYLGIGLGNALPLGITSALATVIPKIADGTFSSFFDSTGGILKFSSVIVSLAGIALCGLAGSLKDKDLNSNKEEKKQEFDLKKGLLFALIGGVMSACFAFGEKAGQPIKEVAEHLNPGSIWNTNPIFSMILIGGFLFNFTYSLFLNAKNKTNSQEQYGFHNLFSRAWVHQRVKSLVIFHGA
jgi:L-rhamnose-H+ transport protein